MAARLVKGARGLIPARAGNTIKDITQNINNGAHPRSRGEHGDTAPLLTR